jgi:hypothetical protein
MSYQMFIDDERFPPARGDWVIVRSSEEAINTVLFAGVPDFISFDHDLGGNDTSMCFIHWLIDAHLSGEIPTFINGFDVHSQNPVGARNIRGLLLGYMDSIGLL